MERLPFMGKREAPAAPPPTAPPPRSQTAPATSQTAPPPPPVTVPLVPVEEPLLDKTQEASEQGSVQKTQESEKKKTGQVYGSSAGRTSDSLLQTKSSVSGSTKKQPVALPTVEEAKKEKKSNKKEQTEEPKSAYVGV